jgi:5-methylcytosine-specific restriction enzyme subunit McrC
VAAEAGQHLTPGTATFAAGAPTNDEAGASPEGSAPVDATQVKTRKVYPAQEHGSVDVPLEDLLTDGELDLYPEVTGNNLFTIVLSKDKLVFRAGRFVGQIPVNDRVMIDVRPRVPFANLERVLRAANQEPLSLAPHARRYVEHTVGTPSMLQSLADSLVNALAAVEVGGLHRQYLRRTADTSFPRGRILMSETMRRQEARGMHHRASVSWFEPSVDTPTNRCAKHAVWYLARRFEGVGRSAENRRRLASLNRLYQMFGGVALDPTLSFLSDPLVEDPRRLPANRAYYERALRLAAMIARGSGVAFGKRGGEVELASLAVNLEDAFEEYLRVVLASGLRVSSPDVRVLDGNRTGPGGGGKNLFDTSSPDDLGRKSPATPDIVLRGSSSAGDTPDNLAVFDVKYKVYTPRAARDDVNQTVTYAASYGSSVAVIVHPHHEKSNHGLHAVGRVGNIILYQYGFDLSAYDLSKEEENFVVCIRNLACVDRSQSQ